jgi:hypothetical protein
MGRQITHIQSTDQMMIAHVGRALLDLAIQPLKFTVEPHHLGPRHRKPALPVFLDPLAVLEDAFKLKFKLCH